MAKRFFNVSLGVLAPALAWNLGAMNASADPTPRCPGCIVGMEVEYAFSDIGQAWILDGSGYRQRYPEEAPPVSAGKIKFLNGIHIITHSEQAWIWSGQWVEADTIPGCGGKAVEKDTWGGIKFRSK